MKSINAKVKRRNPPAKNKAACKKPTFESTPATDQAVCWAVRFIGETILREIATSFMFDTSGEDIYFEEDGVPYQHVADTMSGIVRSISDPRPGLMSETFRLTFTRDVMNQTRKVYGLEPIW